MGSYEADVLVVGSGAAGLAGALAAAAHGAEVVVLERTDLFGGTSAISGGGVWAANNPVMRAAGYEDSREDAITYLHTTALRRSPGNLIEAFVDHVNECIAFLEQHTEIEFIGAHGADYQPDLPGGKVGRSLGPTVFDSSRLGPELKDRIRAGWTKQSFGLREMQQWGGWANLANWDWDELRRREEAGIVGLGRALIGHMMEGCLRHGVRFQANARAVRLREEGSRIAGLATVDPAGRTTEWTARAGVVLACGGFEWDTDLVDRFLGVPMVAPGSPPFNEGDGLRMAMEVGATLANMSDAYWGVMVSIPGDEYEGRQLHRTTTDVRGPAGSIIVNRAGRRFADEAMNYNDFGKVLATFDPMAYDYPNLPCYLVFDAEFRATNTVMTVRPDDPTPAWLYESATLADLAASIGVDAAGLEAEVAEFNLHAVDGKDPRFHRGENEYDRMRGSDHGGPNPNVRALGAGPYYAMRLELGCLGTKGGPLINEHAQVLNVREDPIEGLYACGNAAVSVLGAGYASTLGPILTMGYLAGRHVASRLGVAGGGR